MMTPQQKDLILNALRLGVDGMKDIEEVERYHGLTNLADLRVGDLTKIRAAIKELEAMPTEGEV